MEGGDRIVRVVLTAEERYELELVEVRVEPVEMGAELFLGLRIGAFVEELVEDLGLLDALRQCVVQVEVASDAGEGPVQVLRALRVVPDVRLGELALELVRLRAAAIDVKGTPSRSPASRRNPSRARCARSRCLMVQGGASPAAAPSR